MTRAVLLCSLMAASAGAAPGPAPLAKLPPWAASVAREASAQTPPEEADAWVLLQRTELEYLGEGKVRIRNLRVVHVLGERGFEERSLSVEGVAGKNSKLKRLKAWNARPDGETEELDRSDSISLDDGSSRLHAVEFNRVVKGSVLAFESVIETDHPMGPVEIFQIMEPSPVREWSVEARSSKPSVEVRMVTRHFEPWGLSVTGDPQRAVELRNLPARPRDEGAVPDARNDLPWLFVAYHDGSLTQDEAPSSANWNTIAAWTAAHYGNPAVPAGAPAADPKAALEAIHQRLRHDFTYRQVYLSPERGWVPLAAAEVSRRKFGDCKDLTAWLLAEARAAGFEAAPALARIVEGTVEDDEPANVFAFNHVIAAIRLPRSLGWPAEVETPQGRFLLVDATSRFVPLGRLGSGHGGRKVLVCLDKAGVWVRIPDAALVEDRTVLRLAGIMGTDGAYKGAFTLRAAADGGGLRSTDVEGGAAELRKRCLGMGLPPDAVCDVKSRTDPFDLSKDYEVVFDLSYSQALRSAGGGEWAVRLPGLGMVADAIVKPGRKRQRPVNVERRDSREYEVEVQVPRALVPVLAQEKGETDFRSFEWTAAATGPPDQPGLRLRFVDARRPAYFDFARREEGATAWKKDRAALRRVFEDGLAFREGR
jgi:hypothetical protein